MASGGPRRIRRGWKRARSVKSRWMRAGWWCALLILLASPLASATAEPSDPPSRLRIAAPLLTKLQALAEGLHLELVLCLNGDVEADGVHLTDFSMPETHVTGRDRSLVGACPDGTPAVWHNHPPLNRSSSPEAEADIPRRWREPIAPRELCVLSRRDIETTVRNRYPFIVVSVDADTWCWWSLDQVMAFARQRVAVGQPLPGQAHWVSGQPPSPSSPSGKGLS